MNTSGFPGKAAEVGQENSKCVRITAIHPNPPASTTRHTSAKIRPPPPQWAPQFGPPPPLPLQWANSLPGIDGPVEDDLRRGRDENGTPPPPPCPGFPPEPAEPDPR